MPYAAPRQSIRASKIVEDKNENIFDLLEILSLVLLAVLIENNVMVCIRFGINDNRIILIFIVNNYCKLNIEIYIYILFLKEKIAPPRTIMICTLVNFLFRKKSQDFQVK